MRGRLVAYWLEMFHQRIHRLLRVAGAADEDVQSHVICFRPGVDADVGFGEDGDAGNAGLRPEGMQQNIKDSRAAGGGSGAQGLFDGVDVLRVFRAPEVDEKVQAGGDVAVAHAGR